MEPPSGRRRRRGRKSLLTFPLHGEKVANTDSEAKYDRSFGWVEFDPVLRAAERAAAKADATPAAPELPASNALAELPAFLAAPAPVVNTELVELPAFLAAPAPVEPPRAKGGRKPKE